MRHNHKDFTKKKYTLQPKERSDKKLPYPFFVDEHGMIGRQDFWKGHPEIVIGFSHHTRPEASDDQMSFEEFTKDPQKAVGMYPIMGDCEGEWHTYTDPIETVRVEK